MRTPLAAALALAGCAAEPPAPAPLAGTTWMLEALGEVAPSVPVTLNFGDDRVSGEAPCNRYQGAYARDGAAMTIGPVAATRRACPELDFEHRFLSALTDAAAVEIAGDALTLRGADGSALMRFRRA